MCSSCEQGYCEKGFSKRQNREFLGCHEARLRRDGLVTSDQSLCKCFYLSPKAHGFSKFEWPKELVKVMENFKK
jgi:hypothetical protein